MDDPKIDENLLKKNVTIKLSKLIMQRRKSMN